ncbi:lysophospholipid acyltransferase family protein [uncultured Ilyobacter sp.]|uniref:lysophospholipid acyltransferase family protein n=1 Tax=uncultured Ilyobacter sp. TaxID=544433 RepID=UPI0029F4EB07|nr:lysophospholipid acyltransferase family protein [uncultured Ilyobacter sp.]
MKHKIEYLIILFFIKILCILPEKIRFKIAEFFAIVGYKFIKKRRIITLANLKMAFPDKSQEKIKKIALDSYKIMSKAFLSSLWFEEYLKEEGNVTIENMEVLDKAYSKGKGVIVACMHMGNMEASLKVAEKYHIVTVAKKQRNPYLDRLITKNRERINITLLKKSKRTSRELMKHIKRKDIIALFSDHRDKGATVNFFGETTIAPTGAVFLALRNDLPLIWTFNILNPDNTCTTKIVEEIQMIKTGNFKEDVQSNTQLLINKMEKIISIYPEQWMWFHDRWRLSKKIK